MRLFALFFIMLSFESFANCSGRSNVTCTGTGASCGEAEDRAISMFRSQYPGMNCRGTVMGNSPITGNCSRRGNGDFSVRVRCQEDRGSSGGCTNIFGCD